MTDHLTRIRDALDRYSQSNRIPAIEEPANDFEVAVNEWDELDQLQKEIKKLLKALSEDEAAKRKGLAESLSAYFATDLKEGVNSYALSSGQKLKLTHKITRTVEPSMIEVARKAYEAVAGGAGTTPFDDLLRVKYELQVTPFRKLDPEATNAVSRMIVAKPATPMLEVD